MLNTFCYDLVMEVYQEWAGKSAAFLNVLKDCLVKVSHDKMLKLAAVSNGIGKTVLKVCCLSTLCMLYHFISVLSLDKQ